MRRAERRRVTTRVLRCAAAGDEREEGERMTSYDVLIRGAKVIDGTGNPWRSGDVAIARDRIAALAPPGRIEQTAAAEVVEAARMVVCPGFIDIQSHSVVPLMRDGRCLSKITQGVTTEIMGDGAHIGATPGRFVQGPRAA
jgi:N-acyl-D-aspartate/D-glutamate deacylase